MIMNFQSLALGGQETSLVVEYIMKVFARCWLLLSLVLDSLLSTKIFLTKILGLDICADTLVGDEMLKGISGGQKKRLTSGAYICTWCFNLFLGTSYFFCTSSSKQSCLLIRQLCNFQVNY